MLSMIAGLAALAVWGLDRLFALEERRVWGAGLGQWVRRLDAPDAYVRDSAITAVDVLVSRHWEEIGRSSRDVDSRDRRTLLAAVASLAWRIGDPDSLLREHAVAAVLDVTEKRGPIWMDPQRLRPDIERREPLREVVRDVASAVLHRSAHARSRPDASRSALEVFAAIGATRETVPLIAEIAAAHESPTMRAMAVDVAARSAARNGEPERQRELVLIALCDPSAEVRAVAMEVPLDPAPTCRRVPPITRP